MASPKPRTTVVPLKTPIVNGDAQIKELTLREPRPGELRGLSLSDIARGDTNTLIKLIPRIANENVTENEIAMLDGLVDYANLYEAIAGFLQN